MRNSITRVYSPGILRELLNKSIIFHDALLQKSNIDLNAIEEILSSTTNEERQIIRSNYKKLFHIPIQNDIISTLKENNLLLHDLSLNMFDTSYEYDARELKKALSDKDGNYDDDVIIEIFVSRPKNYLDIIDLAYKNFFEISLKEEIQNKLPGEYSKFLLSLMDTERPLEQTISKDEEFEIAKEIIKNGINSYATDVNLFKKIFIEKSRKDLILISRAYYQLGKKCLYDDIVKEYIEPTNLSDNNDEGKKVKNKNINLMKNLLFAVITPAQFFSQKCSEILTGLKSNINILFRILISRAEIDIKAIGDYYFKKTNNKLKNDIKKEDNCQKNITVQNILINICK